LTNARRLRNRCGSDGVGTASGFGFDAAAPKNKGIHA
jgi:hypothetical protein